MSAIESKPRRQSTFARDVIRDFKRNKYKYLIVLPVVIYVFIFAYRPMYGLIIAFKNYRPTLGIADSKWVGLKNFESLFKDIYFGRIIRNTFTISSLSIVFGFPAPILLALLLNEIRNKAFKRTVQTISYMPYFISIVIVCGLIKTFTQTDGFFNDIIVKLGGTRVNMLSMKDYFYPIYLISGIWQSIGWDSIIYIAALSSIDQEQYEAARVDGAGRFKQMFYITIPGLMPTITILFILRMGGLLSVGFEKILLLYQPLTYEVADVISTYVYRAGIVGMSFSFASAVGIFNSVVNLGFLIVTNFIVTKARDGEGGLF